MYEFQKIQKMTEYVRLNNLKLSKNNQNDTNKKQDKKK
jgi:hypothetical protein